MTAGNKKPGLAATKTGQINQTLGRTQLMDTIIAQSAPASQDFAHYNLALGRAASQRVRHDFGADRVEIRHGFVTIDEHGQCLAGTFYRGTSKETAAARRAVIEALNSIRSGALQPEWIRANITTHLPSGETVSEPRLGFEVREVRLGSRCMDRDCDNRGTFEEHDESGPLHSRSVGADVEICWTGDGPASAYVLESEEYTTPERIDALIAELELARAGLLLRESRRAAECPCWDTSAGACDECAAVAR